MTKPASTSTKAAKNAQARASMLRPLAPIVPPLNVSGRALMVVIAIMSFLCALTLGAVTMVQEKAEAWQGDVSSEITIQIRPAEGLDIEEALREVRGIALSYRGALTAEIVDRSSTARLLEPWLGEGFDMDELPVPRLVIVTIDEAAPPDFAAMRQALAESVPSASLDDHRAWANRLISSMTRLILMISGRVPTIVITFILFGGLLSITGGSRFFTDAAMLAMGRFRGGSMKIAVLASGLFGSISGSAVANVVGTGVVTIPMIKRDGYPAHKAAAIEAVASTGGQLMPPVMGASAFLMAEFLAVPYSTIVLAALVPAILYYVALFIQADLEAARLDISPIPKSELPAPSAVLGGLHFALAFAVLIYALFWMRWQHPPSGLCCPTARICGC